MIESIHNNAQGQSTINCKLQMTEAHTHTHNTWVRTVSEERCVILMICAKAVPAAERAGWMAGGMKGTQCQTSR